jgi:cystathionine gamma-synthase
MHLETLAVHAADPDPATGAVAPPIHLATTFARDEQLRLAFEFQYLREGNPTLTLLESALARLEGGQRALVFGSGMAAAMALFHTLRAGDHVVLPDDAYYGVGIAARDYLARWGVAHDAVDMSDLASLRRALRPGTRLVWLETPSNPLLKITDLAGAIPIARQAGAATVVDNTFPTPVLTRPLSLGADVVLHSATKYLGGHSDLMGGALVFARGGELAEQVEHARRIGGAVLSPFNAWLALRGLRTLPCRMARHSANAVRVAEFLSGHPEVRAVHYPGLPHHPGHEVARRQMDAFGGIVSFHVRGGREAATAAVGRAGLFVRATSLGAPESLIEHRATAEGPGSRTAPDLIRLSVGLEHPDDLIGDLRQALG